MAVMTPTSTTDSEEDLDIPLDQTTTIDPEDEVEEVEVEEADEETSKTDRKEMLRVEVGGTQAPEPTRSPLMTVLLEEKEKRGVEEVREEVADHLLTGMVILRRKRRPKKTVKQPLDLRTRLETTLGMTNSLRSPDLNERTTQAGRIENLVQQRKIRNLRGSQRRPLQPPLTLPLLQPKSPFHQRLPRLQSTRPTIMAPKRLLLLMGLLKLSEWNCVAHE